MPERTSSGASGYKGVYPARNGRWQAQVNHASIGGFPSAWEAGVAVARGYYHAQTKMKKERARIEKQGGTVSKRSHKKMKRN